MMPKFEIDEIPVCDKSNDTVIEQLADVVRVANKLGLYGAADAIEKMSNDLPKQKFACFCEAYIKNGIWHDVYDKCVMDDDNPDGCIFACENVRKELCKFWKDTTFLNIKD